MESDAACEVPRSFTRTLQIEKHCVKHCGSKACWSQVVVAINLPQSLKALPQLPVSCFQVRRPSAQPWETNLDQGLKRTLQAPVVSPGCSCTTSIHVWLSVGRPACCRMLSWLLLLGHQSPGLCLVPSLQTASGHHQSLQHLPSLDILHSPLTSRMSLSHVTPSSWTPRACPSCHQERGQQLLGKPG